MNLQECLTQTTHSMKYLRWLTNWSSFSSNPPDRITTRHVKHGVFWNRLLSPPSTSTPDLVLTPTPPPPPASDAGGRTGQWPPSPSPWRRSTPTAAAGWRKTRRTWILLTSPCSDFRCTGACTWAANRVACPRWRSTGSRPLSDVTNTLIVLSANFPKLSLKYQGCLS